MTSPDRVRCVLALLAALASTSCGDDRAGATDAHDEAGETGETDAQGALRSSLLIAEFEELDRRAADLALVPGPQGPAGDRGPRGPAGAPGQDGIGVDQGLVDEFEAKVNETYMRDGADLSDAVMQLDKDLHDYDRSLVLYQGILTTVKVTDDAPNEH